MNLTSPYLKKPDSGYLSPCQSGIIKCLIYFDIFNYPLTRAEIFENLPVANSSPVLVARELENLVDNGIIDQNEVFYFLNGRSPIVQHRIKLNEGARRLWPRAFRMSKLISRFPFVEGVFITGSLAKNCMDEKGDIDYLVITRPGRLWVCRAMLTTYKKIFLFNRRKYFCVNYYISSDALVIPDENIFTATEIKNAAPTYNSAQCQKFLETNRWTSAFYPNKPEPDFTKTHEINDGVVKRFTEYLLTGWLGERIDGLSFRLFVWRWKKKFAHLSTASFEINFRSRRHVSKHHPQGFQVKVLGEYDQKIREFENRHSVKLY
jgi:hypothetical protein